MITLCEMTRICQHRPLCLRCVPCLQICPSVTMSAQGINPTVVAPHNVRKEEERLHEQVSQARRALLGDPRGLGSTGSFHFDWDMDAMPTGDRVGWELWEQASYLYLLVRLLTCTLALNDVRKEMPQDMRCNKQLFLPAKWGT